MEALLEKYDRWQHKSTDSNDMYALKLVGNYLFPKRPKKDKKDKKSKRKKK